MDRSYGTLPFEVEPDGTIRFLLVWETWGEGHWSPPKGHPEGDETPLETALRELREEAAGLVPDEIVAHDPLPHEYSFSHKGHKIRRRVEYFLVRIAQEAMKRFKDDQVAGCRLVTLGEACELIHFPELRRVLILAHEIISRNARAA